jgi:hypothetical protein
LYVFSPDISSVTVLGRAKRWVSAELWRCAALFDPPSLSGLIKRLLIAVKAGQMAFDFHAVVQDTTHADHLWSHRVR